MTIRPPYCHPADVLRKFDPTLTMSDLQDGGFIGNDDLELVRARIEGVGSDFDDQTRNPYRETRVGTPDRPASYEQHNVEYSKYKGGMKVWLDNQPVVPLDPSEGDTLEVRMSRHRWRDITDNEGQKWDANYRSGWIRIYGAHRHRRARSRARYDNNVRITYRYGVIGGDQHEGGQTTVSAQTTTDSDTIEVEDAGMLPRASTVLIGGGHGEDDGEYIRYSGRDLDANKLIGVQRGVRGTKPQQHDAGSVVHYCPISIREAVAAKSAVELLEYDSWVAQLTDGDVTVKPSDKVQSWNDQWEACKSKHSEVKML